MVKRVLLLLPFLIVQYALSRTEQQVVPSSPVSIITNTNTSPEQWIFLVSVVRAASLPVSIITSTGANTPSKQRVKVSSDVLQLMRQNSQEVQKDKKERKEEFVKRIKMFDLLFEEVVISKQTQGTSDVEDLFFRMDD